MKMWSAMTLSLVLATSAMAASVLSDEIEVKDADGNTLAVVVLCNDCQSTGGKSQAGCHTGAEQGWSNGKPCGSCMIESNYGILVRYGYDLHFTGRLTDPAGQPVKDRFVKLFLPNGWTVRGRTSEGGTFRLMLGATDERKSKQPLVVDLGARVDSQKGNDPHYAMFLLPQPYKPCAEGGTKPGTGARNGKPS